MLEFIKQIPDKFLLFIVVLFILGLYTYSPSPELKDLLQLIIGGYLGILTGGLRTQQNIVLPNGNDSISTSKLIDSIISKSNE